MNIIDAISTRRSMRQFTSRPISNDDLHTILAAGMSGPSAVNARPWSFLVVPHSIIAFGYPEASQKDLPARGGYEDDRVHFEKWQ